MAGYNNPKLLVDRGTLDEGQVTWRSPSNIALVKYWGKHGRQLPQNPSISLTLDQAYTETTVAYRKKTRTGQDIDLTFFFEDKPNDAFAAKVKAYLESQVDVFPFLRQLTLTIRSHNSFPHSAGIASSASSMSALALCLCDLERQFFGTLEDDTAFRQKASYLARLGSGSACRSVCPIAGVWGETVEIDGTTNEYAIPVGDQLHEDFRTFHDDILIVSNREKSVSSRAGHELMDGNPYANPRYQQARQQLHRLWNAMKEGDLATFGQITEQEALTLHALMMASQPPFILMDPNTLEIIRRVQAWRTETGQPLYFTLDAGPNIHLLYPHAIANEVQRFTNNSLQSFCENNQVIRDQVGQGPSKC